MLVKNHNHLRVVLAVAAGTLVAVGMLMLMLVLVEPAGAAFPGENGKIAFSSTRDGNEEIYTIDPLGIKVGPLTLYLTDRLTNNPAQESQPAWSPDGKKIAFTSNRDGNVDIYTMNANGTELVRLTNNPAQDNVPAWSPDGKKIAFTSNRDGPLPLWGNGHCRPGPCNYEIYTVNADGTELDRLTQDFSCTAQTPVDCFRDHSPAWSPDGKKIAFLSTRNGNADIYTMNSNGTGDPVRLTYRPNTEWEPAWSPDGNKIAFTYSRGHGEGGEEIYTMGANGSFPFRRTNSPHQDNVPAWSPDGKKIAFTSNRDAPHSTGEIYTMNANGTELVRLTNNTHYDSQPDWQPLERDPGVCLPPTCR